MSNLIKSNLPCNECGSSDGAAMYENGMYCFSCEKYFKEDINISMKNIKQHFPEWLEQTPEVPQLLFDAMSQIKHLDHYQYQRDHQTLALADEIKQQRKQSKDYMIGLSIIVLGFIATQTERLNWISELSLQTAVPVAIGAYFILRQKK